MIMIKNHTNDIIFCHYSTFKHMCSALGFFHSPWQPLGLTEIETTRQHGTERPSPPWAALTRAPLWSATSPGCQLAKHDDDGWWLMNEVMMVDDVWYLYWYLFNEWWWLIMMMCDDGPGWGSVKDHGWWLIHSPLPLACFKRTVLNVDLMADHWYRWRLISMNWRMSFYRHFHCPHLYPSSCPFGRVKILHWLQQICPEVEA